MLALLATSAFAWQVQTVPGTDTEVWWRSMPLEFTMVDDTDLPDGADLAIIDAFAEWSDVDGSMAAFDLVRAPKAQGLAAMDDHQVVFLDHQWPFGGQALALASVWSDAMSGEMVHFDVRINGDVSWAVDGREGSFDLQSALTHEVGHVLGLDHSAKEEAAMFAALERGGYRHDLDEDDVDGVLHLYPEHSDSGWACSQTGSAGLLLGLLPAMLMRRRS